MASQKDPEKERAYKKRWNDTHLAERVAYNKQWRINNPEKHSSTQRKCRTGWTREQFEAAWIHQDGRCEICKVPMIKSGPRVKNSVCADHDHEMKRPRGLICNTCNTGLGFYEKMHSRYAQYLKEHPSPG